MINCARESPSTVIVTSGMVQPCSGSPVSLFPSACLPCPAVAPPRRPPRAQLCQTVISNLLLNKAIQLREPPTPTTTHNHLPPPPLPQPQDKQHCQLHCIVSRIVASDAHTILIQSPHISTCYSKLSIFSLSIVYCLND